ncbi:amidohydrolase family protein [Pseudoalteromonas sp. Of7M-16]|uniref:amidohydrolase family protein n=1 Tax=Pseudoalteromonas sp. Of7M-16 TaxID=2917756 RepID=UPI001EF5C8A3|nr:amidohydrolase family protein [Pseudoalteromonas sp. Of7M-16]MCG7549642.1 amidohydrolase [Pseudoalteromonas sp. Of7M-16]
MTLLIHDADRHVIETPDIWQDYVDPAEIKGFEYSLTYDTQHKAEQRALRLGQSARVVLPPTLKLGEYPLLNCWNEDIQIESAKVFHKSIDKRKSAAAPHTMLQDMDETHIHSASLFPNVASYIVNHQSISHQASIAYARGYNTWLYEYCSHNPARLKGVGLISRHDPSSMISQLEAIEKMGWTSITMRPEIIAGHHLGSSEYNEFWQACEEKGISIAFHGGSNLQAPTAGTERYTSRFALHACSHFHEMQLAFLSLLDAGVLERHPKLKLGFFEAGASWLLSWLWRLDNICYTEFPGLIKNRIKMQPSEYFKRQCWVTIEMDEPCLAQVIETIGHDRLLFGTDFPHPDHLHFDYTNLETQNADIKSAELVDILQHNPKQFFGY